MNFSFPQDKQVYRTSGGLQLCGDSLELLAHLPDQSVDLIMTSPPFALLRQKAYGNKEQDQYVEWLGRFGEAAYRVLKDSGSFVLDLGGAYKRGKPVRSLYNYHVLLDFCDPPWLRVGRRVFLVQSIETAVANRMGQQAQN